MQVSVRISIHFVITSSTLILLSVNLSSMRDCLWRQQTLNAADSFSLLFSVMLDDVLVINTIRLYIKFECSLIIKLFAQNLQIRHGCSFFNIKIRLSSRGLRCTKISIFNILFSLIGIKKLYVKRNIFKLNYFSNKLFFIIFNQFILNMKQNPQKPGLTGGKAPVGGAKVPTSTGNTGKPDPKHLPRQFKDQFLKKLQACSNPLDFNDESKQIKQKNDRQTYLQQFNDYLNDQNCMSTVIIPHLDLVINMIEKNIFRPLPILKKQGLPGQGVGMQQQQALADPAWPHLQPVYQFFLQLIVNDGADVKVLKVHITPSFIQQFLELFDSEEPRQRQYLKNILHRLYAKLVPRRKMIRKAINDCFYSLIHETFKFNGASQLLDILASIISGFAVPLREQHIIFFRNVIIPLHKVQTCHFFHEHLMRCSMLFLAKDPSLGLYLLDGLVKYWPFANSPKEVMFISELIQVLETCQVQKLEPYIPKVFKRLVKCISGLHLQVADRAMCFFENDYFLNILKTYKSYTFPLLVPVIVHMAETHWHKVLQESLNALKAILKEIDPQAFEKALQKKDTNKFYLSLQDPKLLKKEKAKIDDKWKTLLRMAQQKNPNLKEPVLPYADTHVVGEHNGINNGNVNIA